tara:strand:- start:286 stop:546 length:261 start_codon:yes stop_codon:yes gene_type:complete
MKINWDDDVPPRVIETDEQGFIIRKEKATRFNWVLREAMYRNLVDAGIDPRIATYAAVGYWRIEHAGESIPRSMRKHFRTTEGEEE